MKKIILDISGRELEYRRNYYQGMNNNFKMTCARRGWFYKSIVMGNVGECVENHKQTTFIVIFLALPYFLV